jgi:MoaA/NifB/PqqE/SkfB family radical SAM enzyme
MIPPPDEKLKRIINWFNGRKAPPLRVELNPTYRCNQMCLFCDIPPRHRNTEFDYTQELHTAKYLDIVREGARLGVREWQIIGAGEPMVRAKTTISIMNAIKNYGMIGHMFTNGTLFTEEHIRHIVSIGYDKIFFSLEAPDPKTHDHLSRTKGAWERSIKTIKLFNRFKREQGVDKPEIAFWTVLCTKNYDKLAGMLKLAHALGCEGAYFEPLKIVCHTGAKLKLNAEQIRALQTLIPKLQKLATQYNINTNVNDLVESELIAKSEQMDEIIAKDINLIADELDKYNISAPPCYEPWYLMTILPDGFVGHCCVNSIHNSNYNNILFYSLRDIWYGAHFNAVRSKMLSPPGQERVYPHCARCPSNIVLENRRIRSALAHHLPLSGI